MQKGFTLIELLVVVLIIGILSSVALPQYQKAGLKSRTAEAWVNLKNINTTINAYCLENPSAVEDFKLDGPLSIEVKNSKNFTYYGAIQCSNSSKLHDMQARWEGGGGYSFQVGIHPKTGRRSCSGDSCDKLGFTKFSSDTDICLCGTNPKCYYAD